MSRRVLVPLGLLSLATDPTGSTVGDSYFNTVSGKIRIYDGEDWQDAGISATDLSTAISGAALDNTDDLIEGTANFYHTVQRVNTALNSGTLQNISFTYNAGAQTIDVSVPTVQGTSGTQGSQGTAIQGVQGTQGTQGIQGYDGAQGVQGTVGSQGVQGTQGTQGVQGSEGTQGAQGTVGSQGVQGTQGTQGVQGTDGTQGTSGAQGVQGYSGVDGNSSSYYNYQIKTGTTSGDPGDGHIIYNNATQTSATALIIDHLTSNSVDIDLFLSLLKEGDTLVIQDESDSDNYQQWTVNGAETIVPNNYVTVPVTLAASNGTGTTGFANNHAVILVIVASGVQGPSGAQGAQGTIGAQGVQGAEGTQGVQGTQGTQGVQGTVGSQGTQGTTGTQGTQGVQGTQGPIPSTGGLFYIYGERNGSPVANDYFGFGNGANATTNGIKISQACTVDSLSINANTAFTGTFTVEIYKNTVATGKTLSVLNGVQSGYTVGLNLSAVAGDLIGFKVIDGTVGGTVVQVAAGCITSGVAVSGTQGTQGTQGTNLIATNNTWTGTNNFSNTITANSVVDGTTTTAASGIGYMGIPQNSTTTGAYTVAAADAGKHIYSTATRTITIDSNTNLALPVGTAITFIAATGATVTIAITTDTMYLAGSGSTGSRTLAAFGMATAIKITSTTWIISGNGLS